MNLRNAWSPGLDGLRVDMRKPIKLVSAQFNFFISGCIFMYFITFLAPSRVYETAEQPKKQAAVTKAKLLDGEGPFATHCRTFETTLRELSQQLCGVKERVGELHRDISALRKAQMPPLTIRYECVSRDCAVLDESLERQQQELDRLAAIFNASWEEQLWRLRVEQEVFISLARIL